MNQVQNLEAILFAAGDAVEIENLSKVLKLNREETMDVLGELMAKYEDSGIRIKLIKDMVQMTSNPECYDYVKELITIENEKKLTTAAIEVLSIIAYKQPVTKIEVDSIRGVNSDNIIKKLLLLDLIEERGRLERVGKPYLYGTTDNFLYKFGLKSLKELPNLESDDVKNLNFLEEK